MSDKGTILVGIIRAVLPEGMIFMMKPEWSRAWLEDGDKERVFILIQIFRPVAMSVELNLMVCCFTSKVLVHFKILWFA